MDAWRLGRLLAAQDPEAWHIGLTDLLGKVALKYQLMRLLKQSYRDHDVTRSAATACPAPL